MRSRAAGIMADEAKEGWLMLNDMLWGGRGEEKEGGGREEEQGRRKRGERKRKGRKGGREKELGMRSCPVLFADIYLGVISHIRYLKS